MAYTADDIKRLRSESKNRKGERETSLPSSDSMYTADSVRAMRESMFPSRKTSTQNVYDDYARMATTSSQTDPSNIQLTYNTGSKLDTLNKGLNLLGTIGNAFTKKTEVPKFSSDDALKSYYESLPDYNMFQRIGDSEKRDAYNQKQALSSEYNRIKTRDDLETLKKYGITEDELRTVQQNLNGAQGGVFNKEYMNSRLSREELNKIYEKFDRAKAETGINPYELTFDYQPEFDKKTASDNPVGSYLSTFATNPTEATMNVGKNIYSYATGKPLEHNYSYTENIRNDVLENVDSELGRNVIQQATSMGDLGVSMLLGLATGGGSTVSAGMQGIEKASSSLNSAIDRNLNPTQVMLSGAASGATTYVTEKIPLGSWEKIAERGFSDVAKKDIAKAIANKFVFSLASEGIQEMNEDVADLIADAIIAGDSSEINNDIRTLMANGLSEEEATKQAWSQWFKQMLLDGLGGAISGGFFGGIHIGVGINRSSNIGKNTNREALSSAIQSMDEESEVRKASEKYGNNLKEASDIQVGELVMRAYEEASTLDKARYEEALIDSIKSKNANLTDAQINDIKDAIVAEKPTSEQKKWLKSELVKEVTDEVNRTVGADLADKAYARANKIIDSVADNNLVKALKNSGHKIGAKTQLNGEDVTIKDVKNEDGKITIVTDKGEAQKMTLSAGDAKLLDIAVGMENDNMRKAFIANYDGKQSMSEYADSFSLAYSYGRMGWDEATLREDLGKTIKLSTEAAANAYVAGANESKNTNNVFIKATESVKSELKGFRKGNLSVDKSVNVDKLTSTQRAFYAIAELFTDMGINVTLFNDSSNTSHNGYYKNGTVYINLSARYYSNAFKFDKGYVLNTMAHELTHWMEDADDESFKTLKDTIFNFYGSEQTEKFIAEEQKRYHDNWLKGLNECKTDAEKAEYKKKYKENLSRKGAESEVIARACEDMLSNPDTLEKIMMGIDAKTRKSIIDKFKEFFEKLGRFLKNVLAMDSNADAARMLRENAEAFEQVRQQWIKTFTEAVNNIQSNDVVAMAEDAIVNNNQQEAIDLVGDVSETKLNSIKLDGDLAQASIEANSKYKNVSPLVLNRALGLRKGIASKLKELMMYLPEDIEGDIFSKNDSYGKSGEHSLVCVRSLINRWFIERVANEVGRPLTAEEQIVASEILAGKVGNQRECQYCYVAADRRSYEADFGVYLKDVETAQERAEKEKATVQKEMDFLTKNYDRLVEITKKSDRDKYLKTDEAKNIKGLITFLRGRSFTRPMIDRYMHIISDALNGRERLAGKHLTSESTRARYASDPVIGWYVKDATNYAKSASKAKLTGREVKINGTSYYLEYVAYNGNILEMSQSVIDTLNEEYGLRLYSYSDYVPAFLLEDMQVITDAAVRGLKMLAYTKDLGFVRVFAPSGININISTYGVLDPTYKNDEALNKAREEYKENPNDQTRKAYLDLLNNYVISDAMQGAEWADVKALRGDYENVGSVFVATNDDLVEWALAQDWIDTVIPYHTVFRGLETKEYFGYTNYKDYESDKKTQGWTKGKDLDSIPPTIHGNSLEKYEKALAENHLSKRFPQWADNPNYMKLVNETRLSYSESQPVQPEFDYGEVEKELARIPFEGKYGLGNGFNTLEEQQNAFADDFENAVKLIKAGKTSKADIEKFMAGESLFSNKVDSVSDAEYENLARTNPEEARRILEAKAKANGYNTTMLYHGSPLFGFTKFDLSKSQGAIFLTDDEDVAYSYVGEYVKPIAEQERFNPKTASFEELIKEYNRTIGRHHDKAKEYTKSDMDAVTKAFSNYMNQIIENTEDADSVTYDTLLGIKNPQNTSEEVFNRIKKLNKQLLDLYKKYDSVSKNMESLNKWQEDIGEIKTTMDTLPNIDFVNRMLAIMRNDHDFILKVQDARDNLTNVKSKERIAQIGRYAFLSESELRDRFNGEYEKDHGIYALYAKYKNPLVIDADEQNWDEIPATKEMRKAGYNGFLKTRDIVEFANKNGYDSVIFEGVTDVAEHAYDYYSSDVYVMFDPSQIASADLITYDDNGNVIPLSKRFTNNTDIRFSTKVDDPLADIIGLNKELEKQNEKLKSDVERLNRKLRLQSQITKGKVMKESDLDMVTAMLLKSADSNADKAQVKEGLREVYNYILENSGEGIVYDTMMSKAYDVAKTIMDSAKPQKIYDDYFKGILEDVRRAKIKLTPEQKQEAEHYFGTTAHKAFWGRLNITDSGRSLDSYWSEWSSMYPEIFDENVNPNDQVTELSQIYDSLKDASVTIQRFNTYSDIMAMADEVYDAFWKVRTETTIADKHAAEVKKLNFEHRQAMKEIKEQQSLLDDMYYGRKMSEYKNRDVKKDKEIERLKNKYGKQIQNLRERSETNEKELRQRYGNMIKSIRERSAKREADLRQFMKDRDAKLKDNAERRKIIAKINETSEDLSKRLLKGEKGKKVPQALKAPLAELLTAIDFSSKQLLGINAIKKAGIETKRDIAMSALMNRVSLALQNFQEGKAEGDDAYELAGLHLPPNFATDLQEIADTIAEIEGMSGETFTLNMMTTEELNSLYKAIKAMRTAINNLNKIISTNNAHSVDYLGNEIMTYLDKLGQRKFDNKVTQFMDVANKTPYYFFKQMGRGGQELFSFLQNGWDTLADNVEVIKNFTHDLYTSEEYEKWKNTTYEFDVLEAPTPNERTQGKQGRQRHIIMTGSQIMSLYCLSKREQAMYHIESDGIVIDAIETKKKYGKHSIKQQDTVTLAKSDLERILSVVESDNRMKTVADELQKFMNTVCSKWGNEVTMKLYGTEEFTEKNYFPIHVNQDVLSSEAKNKSHSIYGMLNQSFTKPLVIGASNEINVSDIFDVFTAHSSDMAKYNALALPIMDVIKVWNYKEMTDRGDEGRRQVDAVKKSITKAIGEKGNSYISGLLRDLNGDAESGRYDKTSMKLVKNYKTAAVAANVQTALLQPLAYIRAGYMINSKYLRRALLKGSNMKACMKNLGVQKWKSMGFYDTNLNRGLDKIISNSDSWYDTAIDKALWLTEKMDELTWGYLYTAVELETKDRYPSLKGEEFTEQVVKRLRDVVYATQVFDSTLSKTAMMRSTSAFIQMETSFQAEPILSVNMLMDAVTEFTQEARRTSVKNAFDKKSKIIARASLVYLISSVVESAVRAALKKVRDYDDEDEKTFAGIGIDILQRTLEELDFLNKIPFVKDAMPYIRKFAYKKLGFEEISKSIYADNTRMDTEVYATIESAIKAVEKASEGKDLTYKDVQKIAQAVSQSTGLPISNVIKELKTAYNNTIGRATGNMWK